ncbi:MAG: histidine kinase [Desulfobacterales bacterium]|nr:histidine kinase [Desulfobacterales bacterium]
MSKGGEKYRLSEKSAGEFNGAGEDSQSYFRRLKKRLFISLILAFIVPLIILSGYFHFQFNATIEKNGELHVRSLAESLRNTIDLFLQERVVNIFNLFHGSGFTINPDQADMNHYLQNLMEANDAFIDVGFFNPSGRQVGYAGPHPYLHGKDYSEEKWFQTLMKQEKNYYISDIYMGFRNKPHFTIAVRQRVNERFYVMRATLDPDKFYMFLRDIGRGKSIVTSLINREGAYQIVDPDMGALLAKSGIDPPVEKGSGVTEVSRPEGHEILACAWLSEVPWALIVRQPMRVAYARMYHARWVLIITTVTIIIFLFTITWFSVRRLLSKAESTEEKRRDLQTQLYHAAKLVSVGELAAGVAHEINNPLGIIGSQCGVIRDFFDPEYGDYSDLNPELADKIREEVAIIDDAVYRASDITHKLLKSARKSEAKLSSININQVLDDVVNGFMEREFKLSNIELVRDYANDLPHILVDEDQMRQVFQNLINNAADAIEGPGTITLSTRKKDANVQVTVADTGKGMTQEELGKIFMPFFTTKPAGKGTGLGLGISLSIVEAMGGTIDVQSMPGAGSAFTITLPVQGGEETAENA